MPTNEHWGYKDEVWQIREVVWAKTGPKDSALTSKNRIWIMFVSIS